MRVGEQYVVAAGEFVGNRRAVYVSTSAQEIQTTESALDAGCGEWRRPRGRWRAATCHHSSFFSPWLVLLGRAIWPWPCFVLLTSFSYVLHAPGPRPTAKPSSPRCRICRITRPSCSASSIRSFRGPGGDSRSTRRWLGLGERNLPSERYSSAAAGNRGAIHRGQDHGPSHRALPRPQEREVLKGGGSRLSRTRRSGGAGAALRRRGRSRRTSRSRHHRDDQGRGAIVEVLRRVRSRLGVPVRDRRWDPAARGRGGGHRGRGRPRAVNSAAVADPDLIGSGWRRASVPMRRVRNEAPSRLLVEARVRRAVSSGVSWSRRVASRRTRAGRLGCPRGPPGRGRDTPHLDDRDGTERRLRSGIDRRGSRWKRAGCRRRLGQGPGRRRGLRALAPRRSRRRARRSGRLPAGRA